MFWVEPFEREWQNTALLQISGVSLERNGSESLKLRSGNLCFQHRRDWLSAETIGVAILLSQGADQRWNKVWQVKMNSQCQNDKIKLLIFLFCLSVVALLSIAVQWNSVVSTWRFSFILMQRSRDDGVSCLQFAGRWHFLCYDLHILKVDPYHIEQPLKQFWSCLNDWNLFSIVGQRLLKNVIYDLWKSASPEAFYSPLFAVQSGHLHSLISLHCPLEEALGPWLWMHNEDSDGLDECPDWSESSLGTHHFVGCVVQWLLRLFFQFWKFVMYGLIQHLTVPNYDYLHVHVVI